VAGDMVDAEADGIPNILEFALNGNPTINSHGVLPTIGSTSGRLELHFARPTAVDLNYAVQASHNLTSWTNIATLAANSSIWIGSAEVNEINDGAVIIVTVRDSNPIQTTPVRFVRLAVSRN